MTWENVQPDCMLCRMEQRTHWYEETEDWVVAEKLGGGPFVVSKEHTEELSDEQWSAMEKVVGRHFGEFEIRVLMNLVTEHWHAHIITDEEVDLSDE